MARTDLKVTIDAEAAKLERAINQASSSMQRLEGQIRRTDLTAAQLNKQLDDQKARAMERLGRGMVAFGAATVAGLGLAVKAAIDWETAWTGVLKTVDGTPEQLARVEQGLRDLATTLPATHGEIAAVAEAAGQLGIATDDVVGFTKVMIDLGETTNLSAEEAATSIAQMMNVMQTAPADVGRLGAALVELGNNGASTERDIIQMSQRISGAGAIIGLAEHEVLAISNALASVGISAEAGGTAISTAMIKMADAVASGGESVEGFAKVAGVSSKEFVQAFETEPARAIQMFVEGLSRIDSAGGNVFATLSDLELGQIRVRDALLRMAGAGDLLEQSLADGARAWEENTALIEEAEKRYDTAEAKIQIAKNAVVDFAIDIGGVLLPAIAGMAEGVAELAKFFGDLPGPVQAVVTVFTLLLGALTLIGGGFVMLAPRIVAAKALMLEFAAANKVAYGAAAYTGQFLGLIGGLAALAAAYAFLMQTAGNTAVGVGRATEALVDMRRGVSNELIDSLGELQSKLNDADRILGIIPTSLGGFTMSGKEAAEVTNEYKATVEALDQALAHMVSSGDIDGAKEAANQLNKEFAIGKEQLPTYVDALAAADAEHQALAESIDPLEAGLQDLATQFGLTGEDAAKAAEEMLSAWSEASSSFVDILGAYNDVLAAKEEAERKTAEETAAATEDASDSWEDYVKDVKVSVDEYLAELERQVAAQQNWQANMLILAGKVSAGTLNELAKLGPEGAPLVAELVDASDGELSRLEDVFSARSKEAGDAFASRLAEAGPVLTSIAREHGQKVANSIARGMAENGTTVFQEATRQGINIDRGIGTNRTRNVPVNVPLPTGLQRVDGALNNLARPRFATINVGYAVTGSGLPRGVTGHAGGMVTPGGIIPRFHTGGVPRFHDGASLAGDEVPAILQTGERVLSRMQNRAFEAFTSAFGRAVPVTPPMRFSGGDGARLDPHMLSRLIGAEVGQQINGATLILDDRGRGRLIARNADLYGRGG